MLNKGPELAAVAAATQLAKGMGLNLPDSLMGQAKVQTHLLERVHAVIPQAETQLPAFMG